MCVCVSIFSSKFYTCTGFGARNSLSFVLLLPFLWRNTTGVITGFAPLPTIGSNPGSKQRRWQASINHGRLCVRELSVSPCSQKALKLATFAKHSSACNARRFAKTNKLQTSNRRCFDDDGYWVITARSLLIYTSRKLNDTGENYEGGKFPTFIAAV